LGRSDNALNNAASGKSFTALLRVFLALPLESEGVIFYRPVLRSRFWVKVRGRNAASDAGKIEYAVSRPV
jgi:hypothetical protein